MFLSALDKRPYLHEQRETWDISDVSIKVRLVWADERALSLGNKRRLKDLYLLDLNLFHPFLLRRMYLSDPIKLCVCILPNKLKLHARHHSICSPAR